PQPFDDLPIAVRSIGTMIGDVGVVTDGSFDPIFNILRAHNHPVNRFGVTPAFEQVRLAPEDIVFKALFHPPGCDISNTAIGKKRLDVEASLESNIFSPVVAGASIEISTDSGSKETGLLLLPHGASRWDLRQLKKFRDVAMKHGESWYEFINGSLDRMLGVGDLYLITGVTKSESCIVGAIENQAGGGKVAMKLKAAQVASTGASRTWEWENASSSPDSGPRYRPGEGSQHNQTVFLRGFKIAKHPLPFIWSPKLLSIINSDWSKILTTSKNTPYSQYSSTGNTTHNLQSSSGGSTSDRNAEGQETLDDDFHVSAGWNGNYGALNE
ncbi:hypothetical protein DFH07DRAFT_762103, partial [Mycena maculata]